MIENSCSNCKGYTKCLNAALDNNACRCVYIGELKANVKEATDKLSSIGTTNLLDAEEIKAFIYYVNKM